MAIYYGTPEMFTIICPKNNYLFLHMFWKNYPSWIKYGIIFALLDFVWVTFWIILSLFLIKGEDNLGVGIILWTSQFFIPAVFLFLISQIVAILKLSLPKESIIVIFLLANYIGLIAYFFLGAVLSIIFRKKIKK